MSTNDGVFHKLGGMQGVYSTDYMLGVIRIFQQHMLTCYDSHMLNNNSSLPFPGIQAGRMQRFARSLNLSEGPFDVSL